MDPLETGPTADPPNSLISPGSSPTIEFQGTETNSDVPDLGTSAASLWNDAWIGPPVLARDQPVRSSQTKFPEVLLRFSG
jgi:hypothetical protein